MRQGASNWADCAALFQPCFYPCVITLKEEDGVWVVKVGSKIADIKVAT